MRYVRIIIENEGYYIEILYKHAEHELNLDSKQKFVYHTKCRPIGV